MTESSDAANLDEHARSACLERTRQAVMNILIGVSLALMASSFLLRWRDSWAIIEESETLRRVLLGTLFALVIACQVTRRIAAGRIALRDPATRLDRFQKAHVASAMLGTLAVPLGLAYGWFVRPRLDAVAPFWVAALALGVLAFPRGHELDDLDDAGSPPESHASEPRA